MRARGGAALLAVLMYGGMAFQNELLELLDGYELRSIADFDRLRPDEKHYFVMRLYKGFLRGLDNLADDLKAFGGLKLAYERPLAEQRNRFEDTVFKKFALYSSHAVVTCPIEETGALQTSNRKRIDGRERVDSSTVRRLRQDAKYVFGDVKPGKELYGGELHVKGGAYVVDREAIVRLIDTVLSLREALNHGAMHVVPSFPDAKLKLKADFRNSGVMSGNFSKRELVQQFREDAGASRHLAASGVLSIYLPHVSNVPLDEILAIREREAAAYSVFQASLSKCVFGEAGKFSEQKLQEYMRDLDAAIKLIRARSEHLKRQYELKNRAIFVRTLAFGLVLFTPPEVAAAVLPVLGGFSAWSYSEHAADHHAQLAGVVTDEFFVPWMLDTKARAS